MGINMEDLSTCAGAAALAERRGGEALVDRLNESRQDQEGLELFQRALSQSDDEAWSLLIERFQGLLWPGCAITHGTSSPIITTVPNTMWRWPSNVSGRPQRAIARSPLPLWSPR